MASAITAGSLQQQHQLPNGRQVSGTPPPTTNTGGSSAVNSPKSKLKNQLNVIGSNNSNRLRSKESSPVNDQQQQRGGEVSLEKKILDAILLLNKNKFNVLDEAQNALWQKDVGEKEARIERMETDLQVQNRGVEALGVLLNYLVHDVSNLNTSDLRLFAIGKGD